MNVRYFCSNMESKTAGSFIGIFMLSVAKPVKTGLKNLKTCVIRTDFPAIVSKQIICVCLSAVFVMNFSGESGN